MLDQIDTAVKIYRTEGMFSLIKKTVKYVYSTTYNSARNVFFNIRGYRSFTIDGYTARFDAKQADVLGQTKSGLDREYTPLSEFLNCLRPDDIVWDVGAHVGLYTAFAAATLDPEEGQVIAFEPYPPNVQQLRRNAKLNPTPVTIYNLALSNRDGEIAFEQPDKDTTGAGLPAITNRSDATQYVKTARGDSFVQKGKTPPPTVIKIDVEGAEPLVIEGLQETLKSNSCRVLICEIHKPTNKVDRGSLRDFDTTQSEFETTLENLGFTIDNRYPRPQYDDVHIVATKQNNQ